MEEVFIETLSLSVHGAFDKLQMTILAVLFEPSNRGYSVYVTKTKMTDNQSVTRGYVDLFSFLITHHNYTAPRVNTLA